MALGIKKKGLFRLLAVLTALTLIAAGCGGNKADNNTAASGGNDQQTNEQSGDSSSDSKEPVKLTIWGGVPPEAGPQAVVDAWNAEHPDVQVEYVRYVNDDDGNLKLDTALMTGQNVDLYVNYDITRLKKRIESGVALDLSQFTDYDIVGKMGPDAEVWKVDGKFYGVPTKRNVMFVALNKDALDQAGLEVPKEWTWDDLREYAKALNADGRYGFVQHMNAFPNPLDAVLEVTGYVKEDGTSNMDHPLIKKWLETLYAMMVEDKSTPTYGEQVTSKMPVENMFLNGEVAMLNIGEWLLRSSNNLQEFPRDFTIAFAPVPQLSEDPAHHIAAGGLGDTISINPKSAHIEEAWEFLKWYADGGMMPMAAGGRLPSSNAVDQEEAMNYLLGDAADTYDIASLQYVLFEDDTPTFVQSLSQEVVDARKQEYEKYFLGEQTIDETLSNMVERHNEFLKNNQ